MTAQSATVTDHCPKENQTLQWDLRQSHRLSDTGYPDQCWETSGTLWLAQSQLTIQLADDTQIGPLTSPQIVVSQDGIQPELMRQVHIEYSDNPLTAKESYDLAMSLAERYALPTASLEHWYANALADPTRPTGLGGLAQRRLSDNTALVVEISLSFFEDRPYVVYLTVLWPYDLSRDGTAIPTHGGKSP